MDFFFMWERTASIKIIRSSLLIDHKFKSSSFSFVCEMHQTSVSNNTLMWHKLYSTPESASGLISQQTLFVIVSHCTTAANMADNLNNNIREEPGSELLFNLSAADKLRWWFTADAEGRKNVHLDKQKHNQAAGFSKKHRWCHIPKEWWEHHIYSVK